MADRLPAPAVRARTQPGGTALVTPEEIPGLPGQRNLAQLTALVKTRLKRMQYRPGLLSGFLASTGLDLTPLLVTPTIRDLQVSRSSLMLRAAVPRCRPWATSVRKRASRRSASRRLVAWPVLYRCRPVIGSMPA
jgi:hypothetical protein